MSDSSQSALSLELHEALWHCQESIDRSQAAIRTLSKLVVRAALSQPSHSVNSTRSADYNSQLSAVSQRQLDPSSYSEGSALSSSAPSMPSTVNKNCCLLDLDEYGLFGFG